MPWSAAALVHRRRTVSVLLNLARSKRTSPPRPGRGGFVPPVMDDRSRGQWPPDYLLAPALRIIPATSHSMRQALLISIGWRFWIRSRSEERRVGKEWRCWWVWYL